jgi:ATPase subunit of ABC transporter with duplicated ATPase domains
VEQLEAALRSFTGTLLVVSHDRSLLDAVALDRAVELRGGRVVADLPLDSR